MKHGFLIAGLALAGLPAAAPAEAADGPVALVEDVIGTPQGVEFMDYLGPGRVLRFKAGEGAVISYLASCVREKIVGGVATVGTAQSEVAGGTVTRDKVPCDAGRLKLSTEQAAKSGVVVFRAPPRPAGGAHEPHIDLTLYGLSPLVDLKGGGALTIERLDQPGERIVLDLPAKRLVHGALYDLSKSGQVLVAGGVYRASARDRTITFKVDPYAKPGQAPLVGRLLRF
jgi:hypothetical protein